MRIPREIVNQFGGEEALTQRVVAFRLAVEDHKLTVDTPAPMEAPLVEALAKGSGEFEVIDPPPPPYTPPAVTPGLPPPFPVSMDQPLETIKARAQAIIDWEAESERLKHITPGSGQALEYERTEKEARRWKTGDSLDDYPMLKAEADATFEATGVRPTGQQVVDGVLANLASWESAGAHIKKLRRSRKMRIEQATTPEEVVQQLGNSWNV